MRVGACAFLAFFLLLVVPRVSAQQNLVPAGTLLRCTLDEPHLSPASTDVGDPILCRLSAAQRFGWVSFPRGAYLAGHVDAQKKLGNFGTHGSLTLVFDRIGWPNGTVPARSKVIAVKD